MLQKSKAKRAQSKTLSESETWLLPSGIQDSYKKISSKAKEWTKTPKTLGSAASGPKTLADRKGATQNIWVLDTSTAPRLLKYTNDREGEATFELTEQDGGGTSIKVSFSYGAEKRIRALQSDLHVNETVDETVDETVNETVDDSSDKSCIKCSKSFSREFDFCPHCGSKQGSV